MVRQCLGGMSATNELLDLSLLRSACRSRQSYCVSGQIKALVKALPII